VNDYIVLCDQIIRDESTKKYSLIGLFNRLNSNYFPSVIKPFNIFLQLNQVEKLEHRLIIFDGEKELFNGEFTGDIERNGIKFPDINMVAVIPGLQIESESILNISLYYNDEIVAETQLVVDFPPKPNFRELTRDDIGNIISDEGVIKTSIAEIQCRKCGTSHKYGISIDPYNPVPDDVSSIPENLVHECRNCKTREWIGPMKHTLLDSLGKKPPQQN